MSSELALGDDASPGNGQEQAGSGPLAIKFEEPPAWVVQLNKASNVVFNSGVVALIRTWFNPPKIEVPESMPEWYVAEWAAKSRGRLLASRVLRDTAVMTAGLYLMDGVEYGMRMVRGGTDDAFNKAMGGVTAGSLIGMSWYPGDPRGRATMAAVGSAVGYVTAVLERGSQDAMMRAQRELEKDLLHKSDDELRPDLNPYYLRTLMAAKLQQHRAAKTAAAGTLGSGSVRTTAEAAAAAATAPGRSGFGGVDGGRRFIGDDGPYGRDGAEANSQQEPGGSFGYDSGVDTDGAARWQQGAALPGVPRSAPSGGISTPQRGSDGGGRGMYARFPGASGGGGGGGRERSAPHDQGVLVIEEGGDGAQDG